MLDLGKIFRRGIDALEERRSNFDNLYQDVSDYVMPQRAKIRIRRTPGVSNTTKLYDGTATDAIALASAAAHGSLSPGTLLWFNPTIERELMDEPGVRDWLYELGTIAFETIHASNFDSESQEVWADLFAYCTGCLFTDTDEEDVVRFTAFQPGTFAIGESPTGIVNTIARTFELSAYAAQEQWGQKDDVLPEKVLKQLESGKGHLNTEYVHYVFPKAQWPRGAPLPNANPYISVWMTRTHNHVIRTSGYKEFPYAVPRWSKASGERYGRGPGINALPDIKALNKRVYLQLRAEAKSIDPPMGMIHNSIQGDISVAPGSVNVVRSAFAGRSPFFPLYELSRNMQFTELSIDKQREIVSRRFYLDQIQFPPMRGTPASATEIVARMELMQRILGPVYGRVLREWHEVMLYRVFKILQRAGKFPDPPASLAGQSGNLKFKFDNPITRAQGFADVDAITRALSILGGYRDVWPEITDYMDTRVLGKLILQSLRVPEPGIRDDEAADEVRDGRQEAAQQQAQTEDDLSASKALGQAAPVLKEALTRG